MKISKGGKIIKDEVISDIEEEVVVTTDKSTILKTNNEKVRINHIHLN